jgi:hypothetical protein
MMDHKQMCVANVKYKKSTASDSKKAKGLLRYLTYRDSRDGHIKQVGGRQRWMDHGLGSTVGQIADTCEQHRGEHVLAFTLVFNVNPDLIVMVPEKRRARFVRELTETTLDRFFEERGIEGGIEHSYVTHYRKSEDPQAPGIPDPHTHVILPGTYFDEDMGERVPLFFSRNKQINHIDLLHRCTEMQMMGLLEHYVGPEWELRYDQLAAVREQQRAIAEQQPDGVFVDDHGQAWPVWGGVRRTTEETSAAGFYRYFPGDQEGEQHVAEAFAGYLYTYPDPTLTNLELFAQQVQAELQGDTDEMLQPDISQEWSLDL